jgi:hypothetical protein
LSGRSHGRFDLDRMSAHQSSVHTHRTAQTETIHVTRPDGNFALRAPRPNPLLCWPAVAAPTPHQHCCIRRFSFLLTPLLFPPPQCSAPTRLVSFESAVCAQCLTLPLRPKLGATCVLVCVLASSVYLALTQVHLRVCLVCVSARVSAPGVDPSSTFHSAFLRLMTIW